MLEAQLAFYLNKYLGNYLTGLDPQSLKVSVFQGDVTLKNLSLKPEALNALNLPISVCAGLLGSLHLKVQWSQLGRVPVEISMERLYILARPKADHDDVQRHSTKEEEFVAMEKRVEDALRAWITKAKSKVSDVSSADGGGYLKGFIDVVIGNLQLSIKHIHVRYEDDVSNPGQEFACGLTLQHISANTVDDKGKPTFVTHNPLELLRKGLGLQGLGVYFDVDTPLYHKQRSDWLHLPPDQWDALFRPGSNAQVQSHSWVLRPIDGSAVYLRRGRNVRKEDVDAIHQAEVKVEELAVHLSKQQYGNIQKLLDGLSAYRTRAPFSSFRPTARPTSPAAARQWWSYALHCVIKQTKSVDMHWSDVAKVVSLRERYLAAYSRCLASNNIAGDVEVHGMDKQLPEATVLLFRMMAYTKMEREKRAVAVMSAAEQQSGVAVSGGRTWWGWLTGSEAEAVAASGKKDGMDSEGDMRANLNKDEYDHIMKLVQEQADAVETDSGRPFSVLTKLNLSIQSAGIVFVNGDGVDILQLRVHEAQADVTLYPTTTRVEVAVNDTTLAGGEGKQLIQTGSQAQIVLAAEAGLEGGGAVQGPPTAPKAMSLLYTLKPQDGSADAVLRLALAPSYVLYDAAKINQILDFFKSDQVMNLSALEAQAVAQMDRARQAARDRLTAALRTTSKYAIHIELDAPKVAVPVVDEHGEDKGDVTLVVDFGHFVLCTDASLAVKLSPEEAALYECFSLSGKDLSAYLVDGTFSWSMIRYQRSSPSPLSSFSSQSTRDSSSIHTIIIPLLGQTGAQVELQVARFKDAKYPPLRLDASMPTFLLYVSPARLNRILRVLQAAFPTSSQGERPGDSSWLANADYFGKIRLLRWGGIARTNAEWDKRFAVLYRGKMYIFPFRGSTSVQAVYSVWNNKRCVMVPPDMLGGVPNVIAIVDDGVAISDALGSPSSLMFRVKREEQADDWHRQLLKTQRMMVEIAGLGSDAKTIQEFDADSMSEGGSELERRKSGSLVEGSQASGMSRVSTAASVPTPNMSIKAQLGEFAIFVSGRSCRDWWPEDASSSVSETSLMNRQSASLLVNIDGECSLIALKTTRGRIDCGFGSHLMEVSVEVGNFEIEDLLVGEKSLSYRHLARSTAPPDFGESVDQDMFYDADESLAAAASPPQVPSPSVNSGTASIMTVTFQRWSETSPLYENVDSKLAVSVSTLYFYCNRPTVAALMGLGSDIEAQSASTSATVPADASVEPVDAAWVAEGDESDTDESTVVNQKLVLRTGNRVVFQLEARMQKLQIDFSYEEASPQTFSTALVENFGLNIDVYPQTMTMKAELGNARVVDKNLGRDSLYYHLLDIQLGSSESLIVLELTSHTADESFQESRVPSGLPYWTLEGHMSQIDIVYLNRWLQELLLYIRVMLNMRPALRNTASREPSRSISGASTVYHQSNSDLRDRDGVQPSGPSNVLSMASSGSLPEGFGPTLSGEHAAALNKVESQRKPGTATATGGSTAAQPFVLLFDLDMEAPVLTIPRNTDSMDNLEINLGSLNLSNSVHWVAGNTLKDEKAVLQESTTLHMGGLQLHIITNGKAGRNIIQQYDAGTRVFWKRPVWDPAQILPGFQLLVQMPSIKATITDDEYNTITSCTGENVSETMRVPQGAAWLSERFGEGGEGTDGQHQSTQSFVSPLGDIQEESDLDDAASADSSSADAPTGMEHSMSTITTGHSADLNEPERVDRTSTRVVVEIGKVELELHRYSTALQHHEPLAAFAIASLWVVYRTQASGTSSVTLSLPTVEAHDLRPGIPQQHSLVISSGHDSTFLTLDWLSSPLQKRQVLSARFQRPTIVGEMGFIMGVAQFFVPSMELGGVKPIPYASDDIYLTGAVHLAAEDVFLSPAMRLIADAPGSQTEFVYDGQGKAIFLPEECIQQEAIPLIIVGAGKTLKFRNVKIFNMKSMPACVQFGPGGHLSLNATEGVIMYDNAQLAGADHVSSDRLAVRSASFVSSPRVPTSRSSSRNHGITTPDSSGTTARPATLCVEVVGVGMALKFVDMGSTLEEEALHPSGSSGSLSEAGTASLRRKSMVNLAAAAGSAPAPPPPARVLAVFMDVSARYETTGDTKKSVSATLQGLRITSHLVAQYKSEDSPALDSVENSVLDPCRIQTDISVAGKVTDVHATIGDLRLNLSPELVDCVTRIQRCVAPMMQPNPERPLARCTYFEMVWSSSMVDAESDGSKSVVAAEMRGVDGGVTFWRPQAPDGYITLGDCATSGDASPAFQVVGVAINSGIVAYPVGFAKVWGGSDITIWKPTPPPDYVALGYIVGVGREAPPLNTVGCLHAHKCVESTLGQVITFPEDPEEAIQRLVNVHCIDNTASTFVVTCGEADIAAGPFLDVRTPLGIPPAALPLYDAQQAPRDGPTGKEALHSRSMKFYQEFNVSRRGQSLVDDTVLSTAVNFKRVWGDKRMFARASREGASIWRPVAPPGYHSLGDCLVSGYDPPESTVVVKNSEHLHRGGSPLLRPPLRFVLLWSDENMSWAHRVAIYRPDAAAGYVAMGCVATIGRDEPDPASCMTVRADAVTPIDLEGITTFWTSPAHRQRAALDTWSADSRLHTFVVGQGSPAFDAWHLMLLDEEDEGRAGKAEDYSFNVVISNCQTSVLLCDALHSPVMELDLSSIGITVCSTVPNVYNMSFGCGVGLWSYNAIIRAWEPVVEPCNQITKCGANLSDKTVRGVQPGVKLNVCLTNDRVYVAVAHAWMTSLLNAWLDWQDAHKLSTRQHATSAVERSQVLTVVDNRLGMTAMLQMNFGSEVRCAEIPGDDVKEVLQPLMPPPLSHSQTSSTQHSQGRVLLLGVQYVQLATWDDGASEARGVFDGPELCIKLGVQSESSSDSNWNIRSRGVLVSSNGTASWDERLMVEIPFQSGGPPSSTVSFDLWDVAADSGAGDRVAAGQLTVTPGKLTPGEKQDTVIALRDLNAADQVHDFHMWYTLEPTLSSPSVMCGDGGSSSSEVYCGSRALSVGGSSKWVPVPYVGATKGAGTNQNTGKKIKKKKLVSSFNAALCSLALDPPVMLESSVKDGLRHELLRSNCQLLNTTDLYLEVCCLQQQHTPDTGSAHLEVPSNRLMASPSTVDVAEQEFFENERYMPLKGWSHKHLLPTDPSRYTWGPNTSNTAPAFPLPSGWAWDSPWDVTKGMSVCDEEGWWYGRDWQHVRYPPDTSNVKAGALKFVRRRRWSRRRRRAAAASHLLASRSSTEPTEADSNTLSGSRTVLGVVAPGDRIPLPYKWGTKDEQIQVRPHFPGATASHAWSVGACEGSHTVLLSQLSDSITRLVACPSKETGSQSSSDLAANTLAGRTVWLSITVEVDRIPSGHGLFVKDWTIMVSPPLMLLNLLPVRGEYIIWEKNRESTQALMERQVGTIASGEQVSVYTADMQQMIAFQMYPEGYEWVGRSPTVLSRGLSNHQAGMAESQQLPEKFTVHKAGCSSTLDVFIDRDLDVGAWIVRNEASRDIGSAVGLGVALTVTLFVPVWVVNACHLYISTLLVPMSVNSMLSSSKNRSSSSLQAASSNGDNGSTHGEGAVGDSPIGLAGRLTEINVEGRMGEGERNDPPNTHICSPHSVEMLAAPRLGLQYSGGQGESTTNQRYGIRLKVGSSGWTPALSVDFGHLSNLSAGDGPTAEQVEDDIYIVRAKVTDVRTMHEVIVRVEAAATGFNRTQVVRIEPHTVVTNRTGVPLKLLQCAVNKTRSADQSPRSRQTAASRPFAGALPAPASPSAAPRSVSHSTSLVRASAASIMRVAMTRGTSANRDIQWDLLPSLLPAPSDAIIQAAQQDSSICEVQVVDVPAGTVGLPLDWSSLVKDRMLCFQAGQSPDGQQSHTWSRPITVQYPNTTTHHLAIPVLTQVQEGDSQDDSTALVPLASPPPSQGEAAGHLLATHSEFTSELTRSERAIHQLSQRALSAPVEDPQSLAVLRVSLTLAGPGTMHIVLDTISSDPPYLLENRSPYALQYRQAGVPGASWQLLSPFSAVGYVWAYTSEERPYRLQLREAGDKSPARSYILDPVGSTFGSGQLGVSSVTSVHPGGAIEQLPVHDGTVAVQVTDVEQHITLKAGLIGVGGAGGVLGRGGVDRVLRVAKGTRKASEVSDASSQSQLHNMELKVSLSSLEVSFVNHLPEEVSLLTISGVRGEYTAGISPEGTYSTVRLVVAGLQLDDMSYESKCPVVVAPADDKSGGSRDESATSSNLLSIYIVQQQRSSRRRLYYPYIAARINHSLQFAVYESLIWTLLDLYNRLGLDSATGQDQNRVATQSDVPISISLITVDDVNLKISFKADPLSRPRWATGVLAVGLNIANFYNAPVVLRGFEQQQVAMLRSVFVKQIIRSLMSQLYGVAFSLVKNFGIIGGTARVLSVISGGLASLTADDSYQTERLEMARKRSIRSAGEGLQTGAQVFGKSLFQGMKGVVMKPVEGAQQKGLAGFIKGVGQGLVGAAAKPMSGALDALSVAVEGLDAQTGKMIGRKGNQLVTLRMRLPRAIGGDRKLQPWQRDGSGVESRCEAVGAALLHLTLDAVTISQVVERKLHRSSGLEDAYEDHWLVEDDKVVILSSQRIMLVRAPGFDRIQASAIAGDRHWMDVAAADRISWSVTWDDVLSIEPNYLANQAPRHLLVHRKGRPGAVEEESLSHMVRCKTYEEAVQLRKVALKMLNKYYVVPHRQRSLQWLYESQVHRTPSERLPEQVPCIDFECQWRSTRNYTPGQGGQMVTFWTPVPPTENYCPLGDVVVLGDHKPSQPVMVYRNDAALEDMKKLQERPKFVPPVEYYVVWRHNGQSPVTMWVPKAPEGYQALGCLARGAVEYPHQDAMLCVRTDATVPTHFYSSAIWSYEPQLFLMEAVMPSSDPDVVRARKSWKPHHPEGWKCSVWPVDNDVHTFVALRSDKKPPPENAVRLMT